MCGRVDCRERWESLRFLLLTEFRRPSQNASSDLEVGFQPRVLKNPDEYTPNRVDVEYVHSPLVCAQDKKATVLDINPGIYLETGSPPRWGNLWASWSRGSDSLPSIPSRANVRDIRIGSIISIETRLNAAITSLCGIRYHCRRGSSISLSVPQQIKL